MTSLDLSSQCSNEVPMTPEESLSTPKSGKEKVIKLERIEIGLV